MSMLWGEDPAHTIAASTSYPDARRDIAPVQWQRLAARYGPLPTPPPRAGEIGWDWGIAPDEEWRIGIVGTVVAWAAVVIGCVVVWYAAFLALPIVGDLIRRIWR